MKINYEIIKILESFSKSELDCLIKKARSFEYTGKDLTTGRESKSDKKQMEEVLP